MKTRNPLAEVLTKISFTKIFAKIAFISCAYLSSTSSVLAQIRNPEFEALFNKPLILGASVSTGKVTKSPGDRVSERYTRPENIINIARNGKTGSSYGPIDRELSDRTIIIGIDFLFWDTARSNPQNATRALDALLASAKSKNIPVVLGDVPGIAPGLQVHRDAINKLIHLKCIRTEKCFILEFDKLHKVATTTGIVIKGKRYFFRELMADSLHLNAIGSEYSADLIEELLKN